MGEMRTDPAVLAKEAGNFDRISAELKAVIHQVEATAGALATSLSGEPGGAGPAAQAALQRFTEAANQQILQLNDISNNVNHSGIQYDHTDMDQAAALQAAMSTSL